MPSKNKEGKGATYFCDRFPSLQITFEPEHTERVGTTSRTKRIKGSYLTFVAGVLETKTQEESDFVESRGLFANGVIIKAKEGQPAPLLDEGAETSQGAAGTGNRKKEPKTPKPRNTRKAGKGARTSAKKG